MSPAPYWRSHGPRCFTALAFVLTALMAPPVATADDPPSVKGPEVNLTLAPIFGEGTLLVRRFGTLVASAQNRTARPLSGTLELEVPTPSEVDRLHRVRLDLPAGESRTVQITIPLAEGTSIPDVSAHFEVDGKTLGTATAASIGLGYTVVPSVVTLSDPPRLKPNLLDLRIDVLDPWGGREPQPVQVGQVSFDPRTGVPILPTDAAGWSSVGLLVASARSYLLATPAARAAILSWARGGGEVLLFPRTLSELSDPAIVDLVGRVELDETVFATSHELVPNGIDYAQLRGDETFRPEPFGGSRRVGFGRVYVATFDGTSERHASSSQVRMLVESIISRDRSVESGPPLLRPGIVGEMDDVYGYNADARPFGPLRAALDPNEAYVLVLLLAAIVLVSYVVFVGPLNFRFVERRGTPTLALVTTPLLAVACLGVLLTVGYISKGTRSRYQAVTLHEIVEGDDVGIATTYRGLFLVRPHVFSYDVQDANSVLVVQPPREASGSWSDHGAGHRVIRDLRANLWETLFVREEREIELDGSASFELDKMRLSAVRSTMAEPLAGALVIDAGGRVYAVGDVPAGGRVEIPTAATMVLGSSAIATTEQQEAELARMLGIDPSQRAVFSGLLQLLKRDLTDGRMPVLLARLERPSAGEISEIFKPERELDLIRIVPDSDIEVSQ